MRVGSDFATELWCVPNKQRSSPGSAGELLLVGSRTNAFLNTGVTLLIGREVLTLVMAEWRDRGPTCRFTQRKGLRHLFF